MLINKDWLIEWYTAFSPHNIGSDGYYELQPIPTQLVHQANDNIKTIAHNFFDVISKIPHINNLKLLFDS